MGSENLLPPPSEWISILGLTFVLQITNPLDFITIQYTVPPQEQWFFFSESEVKMQCINNSQLKPQKQNSLFASDLEA